MRWTKWPYPAVVTAETELLTGADVLGDPLEDSAGSRSATRAPKSSSATPSSLLTTPVTSMPWFTTCPWRRRRRRAGSGIAGYSFITIEKVSAAVRPGGVFSMQCRGEPQMHGAGPEDHGQRLADIREAVDHCFPRPLMPLVIVPSYHERWHFLAAHKPLRLATAG